jgi:5-formyltetrahydrofolate cyclo-ligase
MQVTNSEQFCELFIQKFIQTSISHPVLKNIQNIGVYLAQTGELNLSPLIKILWALNKNIYVPMIQNQSQNQNSNPNSPQAPKSKMLKFGKYTEHTQCRPNSYFEKFGVQILEPIKPLSFIHPAELDLVLLPLLAFDSHGTRLGTGGGYYDATFNPIKNNKNNTNNSSPKPKQSKPYLLGCAFDFQQSKILIPKDPWDVKLDGALTNQTFCEF